MKAEGKGKFRDQQSHLDNEVLENAKEDGQPLSAEAQQLAAWAEIWTQLDDPACAVEFIATCKGNPSISEQKPELLVKARFTVARNKAVLARQQRQRDTYKAALQWLLGVPMQLCSGLSRKFKAAGQVELHLQHEPTFQADLRTVQDQPHETEPAPAEQPSSGEAEPEHLTPRQVRMLKQHKAKRVVQGGN